MDKMNLKVEPALFAENADRMRYELKFLYGNFLEFKDIVMDEQKWTGSGADACRAAFQRKDEMIDEIKRRFLCDINDLNQIAGVYVQTEAVATETVDSLPSNLLI